MLKESKARIKAARRELRPNWASGSAASAVSALWRYSQAPKVQILHGFLQKYKWAIGADQVSHQIAISSVLRMLLEKFGKSEVKVNV